VIRTRATTLVGLGFLGAVAGVIVQYLLPATGLPKLRPEYSLAVTLVLIALVVVVLAIPVRRAVRGLTQGPIDPFYATRVAVLAKASSLSGALLTGVAAGLVIEVFTRSGSSTADSYVRVFATLVGAIALLVAGLLAEFFCSVPPRGDDDDPAGPAEAGHVHGG
jgi:hypothetical protein